MSFPLFPGREEAMRQAEQYLRNAENCADLAETARDQPTRARYKRMAEAWLALAREQDWLDGKIPPINIAVNGAQKTPPW
jgi:hypothetical protein